MSRIEIKWLAYGDREIEYLKQADPELGKAIERIGRLEREVIPDLFTALVNAIIGQLISVKAAQTVWYRMQQKFGVITPEKLASHTPDDIQSCGMSMKKAVCIHTIAQSIATGEWGIEALRDLPDEEVIRQLSGLNGIGRWTAEMLLIHSMERPDVVSWGDIAIRRGMMRLYNLQELPRQSFEEYRRRYSPYGTVASIYLWALSSE